MIGPYEAVGIIERYTCKRAFGDAVTQICRRSS